MSQSQPLRHPLIFADSNVFIEALFVEDSPASTVIRLVALDLFELATCKMVITDVENAILNKVRKSPNDLDDILQRWSVIVKQTNLIVHADPAPSEIRATYESFIALMRHKNDIPVLTAALRCNPVYILSGNREHFSDSVAKKCGIAIFNCAEFIELVGQTWTS
jgi:predicted nucleic acid-binding protein